MSSSTILSQVIMAVLVTSTQGQNMPGLFRRQNNGCNPCTDAATTCPVCPTGEGCILIPRTCDVCAKYVCKKQLSSEGSTSSSAGSSSNVESGSSSSSGSTPIGAVIGGVVGGLLVIAILGFFIYKNYKKKRSQQQEQQQHEQHERTETMSEHSVPYSTEKSDSYFDQTKNARASTHTVNSIASTVMTRASNVIQIAYIPGVTNLSNPNSPGSLIPPVPPLPLNSPTYTSAANSPNPTQQVFSPNPDLPRNSTYSQVSTIPDRSSVATTIYRSHAVISPVAAQPVRLGKANIVQVSRSPASTSQASSPGAPPVPNIDYSTYGSGSTMVPTSPAFSVGSTFLKKMSTSKESLETTNEADESNDKAQPYLTPAANTRISKGTMVAPKEEESPFSDRASLDVPHPNNQSTTITTTDENGRTSPATFREGDIRISLRPMSEMSEIDEPTDPNRPRSAANPNPRPKSPFDDKNKVQEKDL